ncbi:flavodoxin domain-containing protein [Arthrobacter sp. B2a2-09]|uniref:flavodoxin domain-containing protein n=1 Tax=Arthrobacter sp. B2a2-09 TaxID=2952822 RepID=UPI0022CD9967|nr:flavodoxin domain-containing protein [Arthrobacter sp. B2a2-09]MCZ9881783.1 flavodoxin domain-containing protein [Arthrobacter sp. B2a2-09]
MSKTVILYGTESGNAELVAEDIGEELNGGSSVVISDMSDFDVAELSPEDFYIIICSTHGDGELPTSARPFHESLSAASPDLSGVKYAIFGLGDSSYETYSKGSEHIDRVLTELGAERVGEYGRHDAADGSLPNDAAVTWSQSLPLFV